MMRMTKKEMMKKEMMTKRKRKKEDYGSKKFPNTLEVMMLLLKIQLLLKQTKTLMKTKKTGMTPKMTRMMIAKMMKTKKKEEDYKMMKPKTMTKILLKKIIR